MSISLVIGDITKVEADVIVNAANSNLFVGGGVCGAIHRAGGPSIAEECRARTDESGVVPVGEAAITGAGRLPARWVVHAVGPMWTDGTRDEAALLASAYRSAIALADSKGATSIAFPSISTGIFRYPVPDAARVAIQTVRKELLFTRDVEDVKFVLFDQGTHDAYASALERAEAGDQG